MFCGYGAGFFDVSVFDTGSGGWYRDRSVVPEGSNGGSGFERQLATAILTAERLSGDSGAAGVVFTGHAGLGIWQWLSMCGGYVLRLGLVCAIGFPSFFRMMGQGM